MALFKIKNSNVEKLSTLDLEKEKNIQTLFDKNGSPVIIEYKRNQNDNVINQGLSYLRWLLDHKADFEILCRNKKVEVDIDWTSPRVICVAESYNKFDLD